ncbi:MAG TPA: S41 family peptidase [Longimicrobiaceae bacterium]|nr:S41 family peptidase [Longimicrobiaceae bacterium]
MATERNRTRGMRAAGLVVLLAALAVARPGSTAGQDPSASAAAWGGGEAALTPQARSQVVDSIARVMERTYVSADTGRMIADHLRGRMRSGAYDRLAAPRELAAALTADLQAVNGDRHLYMTGGGGGGPVMRMSGGDPERARRENYHFHELKWLDGNVGYLRLRNFADAEGAFETAEHALRFLENTDAVIIDLRGNGGGSGRMSAFLLSHFTEPGLHFLTRQFREDPAREERTLAQVPGPRRTDVPLYVLIDGRSFSAAESFAFALQTLGRATLVGERTRGGGRNNRFVPVGHGLSLSVTYSRVFSPRTGKGWEATGVQPDIAVSAAEALETAHRAALEAIRGSAPGTARAQ